jgi:DNA polymerase III subunit epsilon
MYPIANPKVIQRTRQILAYEPIFLDTETTGFSPDDVVIEVGVVDLTGVTLYETLIKPSISYPS